jgi:excisionase family DNA binding protein
LFDDWLTTEEAAKMSGYHIEYVRRLARSGIVTARKWGHEWMVDRQSFQEYLASEKKPGPKPGSKPSSN